MGRGPQFEKRCSTCSDQHCAHHQESQLYQCIIWYMSLCVGDHPVCRSGLSCIPDGQLHRLTYARWCNDTIDSPECSVLLPLYLVHDKRCLVSHWPPASEIGMLLITTFVELRVVAGRNRKRAGSPQAVSRRTCCAVVLRRTEWSEHGMGMTWQV